MGDEDLKLWNSSDTDSSFMYSHEDTDDETKKLRLERSEQNRTEVENAEYRFGCRKGSLITSGRTCMVDMDNHVTQRDQLIELVELGLKGEEIADVIGVCRKTVHRRLSKLGISLKNFTVVTDGELEDIVQQIIGKQPNIGSVLLKGMLESKGIHIPRKRVEDTLSRVKPDAFKHLRKIKRRQYAVRAPLSMIHLDSHHKLKDWRFVVHGAIDGYSRHWFYLNVCDNNRADSALIFFKKGVQNFGLPSRIRCDKGMENIEIARFMLNARGENRGSVITGTSVHNVRIESNWRGVFEKCLSKFYTEFKELEMVRLLDNGSDIDMYFLHFCYMHLIQEELDSYAAGWNHHKLRTESNRSPAQLFTSGLAHLRDVASRTGECFTELDQIQNFPHEENCYEGDEAVPENLYSFFNEEPVVVQSINCPLTYEDHVSLRKRFSAESINLANAHETYQLLRNEFLQIENT